MKNAWAQARQDTTQPPPNSSRQTSVRDTLEVLLGQPTDPLSSRAISAIARIVMTPDDRALRTAITGRRRITTGIYPSAKSARPFPFEGMNEQAFLMHCEVDTEVVDYRAQPFRFEFVLDGVKRIYIADCARLLDSGRIEVVEVKNDRRALKDPDYAQKLAYVREVCTELGWGFRVVMKDQIFSPPAVYANVVEIQSRRQVKFDAAQCYLTFDLIERMGGQTPLGKLAETIGERRVGRAVAMAMMVARQVKIDLSVPLCDDSVVSLVSPSAASVRAGDAS